MPNNPKNYTTQKPIERRTVVMAALGEQEAHAGQQLLNSPTSLCYNLVVVRSGIQGPDVT